MRTLGFILACFWYTRILRNILSYVHLWYVKEYRIDRMLIHIRTKQGKQLLNPIPKKPPISVKTILLVVFLVASTCSIILFLPFNPILNAFIADILTFPLSFVFVLVLRVPTLLYHEYCIAKAVRMLQKHTPMIVIGVTGSFGKTSTKEFLATILSKKYKVLKTEASKNSPIGIAEVIISHLKSYHEVFIVEMGAYKRGEIAKMTSMVKPGIGIITAINAQHQDLFGSLAITMKAKYELLEGLSNQQIAIVNIDNPYTVKMAHWAAKDKKTVWAVSQKSMAQKFDRIFSYSGVQSDIDSVSFSVSSKKQTFPLSVNIRGEHFAPNIMLAIAGSVASGMTLKEAVAIAKKYIEPVDRVMELTRGQHGQQIINDTFNNNPDAAIAALHYMAKFKGKKFLVFQPMIELGSYSFSGHKEVGKVAATLCDEIILTNANFSEGFIEGVKSVSDTKNVHIMDADAAAQFLRTKTHKNDTILCKGKEAAFVFKKL